MRHLLEDAIPPKMRKRIETALSTIERDHDVEILLAVESGSRAWGFPSRDSDYDVRFIYQRKIQDYLTVVPRRDVIELPIDDELDINGWDLRKALALLVQSNATLLEWLTSPLRYRDSGSSIGSLLDLARASASLRKLRDHYEHQVKRNLAKIQAFPNEVPIKTYCYALREAMALRWLQRSTTPPPMDLISLMSGVKNSAKLLEAVTDLIAQKADSKENDIVVHISILNEFILDAILAPSLIAIPDPDRLAVLEQADAMFASMVLDARRHLIDKRTTSFKQQ